MPGIESDRWLISKDDEIIFAASGERRTPGRYARLPDLTQLTCPGWPKSRRLPRIGRESLLYDRIDKPRRGYSSGFGEFGRSRAHDGGSHERDVACSAGGRLHPGCLIERTRA